MELELRPLDARSFDGFAQEMQEAFQLAIEDAPEEKAPPVLPRKDIDASLAHPNAQALEAICKGERVGGAVLFLNEETMEHECALLYVKKDSHSKGVGTALWKAIEKRYPETVAWKLCTPYFEVRNINFYLKKCGFRIVDLFEEMHKESGYADKRDLMFSFVKRLDGKWS
jgi:GNAT superfamily N-acetyltransferase